MVLLLVACSPAAGGGTGHDVVPKTQDVPVQGADGAKGTEGYEYVARRPLGLVALAEARGLDAALARVMVDRLADALDACASDQGQKGTLVDGAARVVAQIDEGGNIAGTSVRFGAGPGVAENAALCFVAPVKMLTFPPANAGARGFAVEALWGRGAMGR